ncbi:MAG: acetate--CoA ligase [Pseudomonadota bacterium]
MRAERIEKPATGFRLSPNMPDYRAACQQFDWQPVKQELFGNYHRNGNDCCNLASLAVDRHVGAGRGDRIALRLLTATGCHEVRFIELQRLVNQFANALQQLQVERGERLFVLTGRRLELFVAVLGGLKYGMVVSPLYSAFGPEPLLTRLRLGEATVLVTTDGQYQRKLMDSRARAPTLRHVLLIRDRPDVPLPRDCEDFHLLTAEQRTSAEAAATTVNDPALLHFTSGTTGTPKGALHVHGAALTHYLTGKYALDLHADDVFWCTADPGWVTGTSYGILAPLLHGVTSVIDAEEFDAERWYRILQSERVSVWYTAPTAIRLLMKAGDKLAQQFRLPSLRFVASVGEPLNAEAIWWSQSVLGLPIHDNWWQTETGGIMIGNFPALPIKPGSMGMPLPGVEAAVVAADGTSLTIIDAPDVTGELALRRGWPAMFRAYLGQDERYRRSFIGDWYLTGDLVRRDADGYYWFIGRKDDVIKSAGHLIGPFEVESVLMEHPAVAEAAVIGMPDALVGEVVMAFVSIKSGFASSEALQRELLGHARKRLGAAVAPKTIRFVSTLPRTRSGKIMRRLLKARELGLPEGDLSTLEPSP